MVTGSDELDQVKLGHVFPGQVGHIRFNHLLHPLLILLAVKSKDLLDFAEAQMEPLGHELEESVSKNERECPDHAGSHQLNAQKVTRARCQKATLLVDQPKGNDSPEATEQVSLCGLQWIIKLEAIEYLTAK